MGEAYRVGQSTFRARHSSGARNCPNWRSSEQTYQLLEYRVTRCDLFRTIDEYLLGQELVDSLWSFCGGNMD
jgi:hypothetical protein